MVLFMAALQQTGRDLSPHSLEIVWRGQYAIACVILFGLTAYRLWKLQESGVWNATATTGKGGLRIISADLSEFLVHGGDFEVRSPTKDAETEVTEYDEVFLHEDDTSMVEFSRREHEVEAQAASSPIPLFFKTQWHRLVGTSVGWAVWDVAFYGG